MSGPPSFSSFPPSFGSFPDADPGPSQRGSSSKESQQSKHKDRKHEDSKSRRKDDKDRHRHDDKPRKEKRKEDKYYASYDADVASRSIPVVEETATRFFYSDRKGDLLNVKYGGLHAGDVPKYHLVARGRQILGLSNAFSVVHRDRHGLEVAVGKRRKVPALTDSKTRHLLAAPPTKRLVAPTGYKYEEEDGFLRISSAKAPSRDVERYRDPELAGPVDFDDSESDSAEEESSDEDRQEITLDSRQNAIKELERHLSSNPTSVSTWLSLLSNSLANIPLHSKNASKARAEISLSIISRAIEAHRDNRRSSILRLKLLSAAEELWNEKELDEEWEDALEIGGVDMWLLWLDWRLRMSRRGIESLADDVRRIYSALPKDDVLGRLRILWRAAVALRDAGYIERAHAVFQAQAELTFKRPDNSISSPFEVALDHLEAFWESEVPRIGEQDAKGWAAWESSGRPDASSGLLRPPLPKSSAQDPFCRWATDEIVGDRTMILPCRSFDEEASSDPYAAILFSDIRPFLVNITSDDMKRVFRMLWLSFLGLHIPGFSSSLSTNPSDVADDRWCNSHLACYQFLATLFPPESNAKRITADSHNGVLVGKERGMDRPFGPVKNWGLGLVDAMEGMVAGRYRMWSQVDIADAPITIVREVFAQCKLPVSDADWDILQIAFEAAANVKQAIKVSKQLLSVAQESSPHWKAHAQLERSRGRADDARKVYSTVLSSNASKPGVAQLWWDWAELEWLSGSSDAAVQVICRSSGTTGAGTIALLRARRALDDAIQGTSSSWKDREAYVKLRALLELLTTGSSPALLVFDQASSSLTIGGIEHESLTVAALSMLYVQGQVLSNAFKLSVLRERVEHAMRLYPDNTLILGFFLAAEKGEGIWGRVRAMLAEDDSAKHLTRVVADIWAVGWEKGSWKLEEERIRTKLSNAAQNERIRYSAILWRIFLDFEIRCGRLTQAKTLLFRAVKECPLVKDLYLLAFGSLRSVFSPRELNDWAETMGERGIRMRQGLDELLEGWTDTMRAKPINGESDEEDEIEYNAKELRRLRPY